MPSPPSGELTVSQLTTADAQRPSVGRVVKLQDGGGLFAQVQQRGAIGWRLRYYRPDLPAGKRDRMVSLGTWPDVSLEQAREKAASIRAGLATGKV